MKLLSLCPSDKTIEFCVALNKLPIRMSHLHEIPIVNTNMWSVVSQSERVSSRVRRKGVSKRRS